MNSDPQQELKDFRDKYPIESRGVYFLRSYANELLRIMDKYKDVDYTSIFYMKVRVVDLIDGQIEEAIVAYNEELKSKRERYSVAENKFNELKSEFLNLYNMKYH